MLLAPAVGRCHAASLTQASPATRINTDELRRLAVSAFSVVTRWATALHGTRETSWLAARRIAAAQTSSPTPRVVDGYSSDNEVQPQAAGECGGLAVPCEHTVGRVEWRRSRCVDCGRPRALGTPAACGVHQCTTTKLIGGLMKLIGALTKLVGGRGTS